MLRNLRLQIPKANQSPNPNQNRSQNLPLIQRKPILKSPREKALPEDNEAQRLFLASARRLRVARTDGKTHLALGNIGIDHHMISVQHFTFQDLER